MEMTVKDAILIDPGNVTNPCQNGLICHCVNDSKRMGSGVALALLSKWSRVKSEYMNWDSETFKLGNIQIVWVEKDLAVVNMIGQHGIISDGASIPPIRYDSFKKCLQKVYMVSKRDNMPVHIPFKIGSSRAGGDWNTIQEIIKEELSNKGIQVYIYKFDL